MVLNLSIRFQICFENEASDEKFFFFFFRLIFPHRIFSFIYEPLCKQNKNKRLIKNNLSFYSYMCRLDVRNDTEVQSILSSKQYMIKRYNVETANSSFKFSIAQNEMPQVPFQSKMILNL